MEKIKVLIVDDVAQTREDIKRLLYFEKDVDVVGEAANGAEAVSLCANISPDVVLMDINMPVMDGITAAEKISLENPKIAVIVISIQSEQGYLKRAMMAGAREFLVKPFSSDELIDTIRKVYRLEKKRQEGLGLQKVALSSEKILRDKQVIVIQSLKGGVGKSIIAANLAVALQQRNEGSVALVDLDLQGGDMAVMLNLMPRITIADIVQEKEPDIEVLKKALIKHPTGISVLPAPLRPEQGETVHAAEVEVVIKLLKDNFQYVVIDTPPYFHETNLTALDMADKILVICSPDLPTIKNVRIGLETLESLDHKAKLRLILNRSNQEVGINPSDVEESLSYKIFAHIPSDGKTVIGAVNRGQPFVLTANTTKIAQQIINLSGAIVEGKEPEQQKIGFLKKLFA